MIRREDQKGDTVTFNHIMAGTITSRNYRTSFCRIGWAANSPSGTIADSDTFTFDNLGRMLTAVSGRYTNTVTMTYDSYGRLKDESLTLAGQTYTVTRAYDTRSRLTQLTYPNGSIVQRTYTTRSQLHTVRYLGTTVDTRTYDDGGRLGTSTYANGAVVSFAYRNDNLPTSIATTHAGSPNIGTYSYTWDANKNKTGETITSTMSGFGFSTGATGYDDEDRLQTWNRTNGTMNQAWTLSAVGNWNNFTSAGSTWNRTHSNAHEFTGFTGASTGTLAYDVKGNQTSRPSTLSAPALNLDWNFDNQLRGADTNGSAGSLEVTFEYDALGRRVSRSHSSGNVVYVHAGQQVIADYARGTAAASPTYRYVYAEYVDEPIVRHTGTATTLPTTGDNALYFHRNQQYSIIGLTNAAGTLVERYSYTAYGTLGIYDASGTVRTTSTYANRYIYTGREWDADLNLYHFRARWYDPSTGGFISRDPLGYVDGMSLYRGYFGVRGVDPRGLDWWDPFVGADQFCGQCFTYACTGVWVAPDCESACDVGWNGAVMGVCDGGAVITNHASFGMLCEDRSRFVQWQAEQQGDVVTQCAFGTGKVGVELGYCAAGCGIVKYVGHTTKCGQGIMRAYANSKTTQDCVLAGNITLGTCGGGVAVSAGIINCSQGDFNGGTANLLRGCVSVGSVGSTLHQQVRICDPSFQSACRQVRNACNGLTKKDMSNIPGIVGGVLKDNRTVVVVLDRRIYDDKSLCAETVLRQQCGVDLKWITPVIRPRTGLVVPVCTRNCQTGPFGFGSGKNPIPSHMFPAGHGDLDFCREVVIVPSIVGGSCELFGD